MDRKEKSWLPIIEKQEELLVFDKFDQEDVWKFAQKCVELATDKYKKGVAIRVILEGTLVFSYLMKDSNIENNWWMEKKLNVVAKTQVSSLRSSIEYEFGVHKKEPWCDELGQYALCGGCIPIWRKDRSIIGYVLISNLTHECDHQLAADALAYCAGVEIPSVV